MADTSGIVALGMSTLFLWAALDKARSPASVQSTLSQLGVPDGASRRWVRLLIAVEIAVAIGLLGRPDFVVTFIGVVGLAAVFAGAGVAALTRRRPIACSCFGLVGNRLGWGQVVAFPIWVTGATVVWLGAGSTSPSFREGALALAIVGLTMAGLRVFTLVPAWRDARADRQSAEEMLTWLPR